MLIAFKGFDKDLTCTNHGNTYQYRLGVWNEEDKANCGINGMHCAENPLDCLSYYPDWDRAVYYMVVADGDIDEDAYDSKISCTRLRLIKKLDKGEFVAHSLKYLLDLRANRPKKPLYPRVYRFGRSPLLPQQPMFPMQRRGQHSR